MQRAARGLWGPVLLRVALAAAAGSAQAESLQCSKGIAAEGDTRLSVLYKCGEPQMADRLCAPVTYRDSGLPVPAEIAAALVPCLVTEQWIYERGPGNLVATVHIRSGRVHAIRYGKAPD